jgi:hypothetical protein
LHRNPDDSVHIVQRHDLPHDHRLHRDAQLHWVGHGLRQLGPDELHGSLAGVHMVVEQYVQWHTDFVRVALRVDVLDAAGLQLEWDRDLRRVDYALLPAQSDAVHVGAGVLDPSVSNPA